MAPGRIEDHDPASLPPTPPSTAEKPTVYLLDTLHPKAVEHAQSLFNAVLPSDPNHSEWREKAEYLLIRGSYLTADDVEKCKNLKAIGKQGVGKRRQFY
jgi:phosphoglycerate dehydrogenase-like enzyme